MQRDSTLSGDTLVFVAAKRTPFGTFGGSLKGVSATDLAVHSSKAALSSAGIPPEKIDHVTFGNVIQSSSDAAYLARHVGLKTGVPLEVPALTLNRLCGSGFEALADVARRIRVGEATVALAGGTENMSQSPYVLRGARFGYRMNHGDLEDSLIAGLFDTYANLPMALTAERLAEKYSISREEADAFALRSQQNTQAAYEAGWIADELAPVSFTERGKTQEVGKDENPRPSTIEGLQKLKSLFKKDGTVTAGTASGICDGAASLVLTTAETAKLNGWNVLGKWITSAVSGCEPKEMGIGPVYATKAALLKADLKLSDLNHIEINEAFAAQVLAVQKELGLKSESVNPHGGAIAIGHPLGASGARLTAHALYALKKRGGGVGLVSACIGGGQGMAILLEV